MIARARPDWHRNATRGCGLAQVGEGVALCVRPGLLTDGADPSTIGVIGPAASMLGLRLIGQGIALIAFPGRAAIRAALVIDALHATSMVALASVNSRYRRAALGSAVLASASVATLAAIAARSDGPS